MSLWQAMPTWRRPQGLKALDNLLPKPLNLLTYTRGPWTLTTLAQSSHAPGTRRWNSIFAPATMWGVRLVFRCSQGRGFGRARM